MMVNLPGYGLGEIILIAVYLTITHYFVKVRVKEELAHLHEKVETLRQNHDKRLDELELYIRRVNAIAELNQRIVTTSPKIRSIIERLNSGDTEIE